MNTKKNVSCDRVGLQQNFVDNKLSLVELWNQFAMYLEPIRNVIKVPVNLILNYILHYLSVGILSWVLIFILQLQDEINNYFRHSSLKCTYTPFYCH